MHCNDSIMVQLSNEAYQHQQQSYSGGRLSYYNDHQQVNTIEGIKKHAPFPAIDQKYLLFKVE